MELFEILGIAFVVAFIISTYGFLIFVICQMGKLTKIINSIPSEMRRESDSRASPLRLEQ